MFILLLLSLGTATKIRVVSPSDLRSSFIGGINVSIADFGYVPYGHNIFGTVFITENACQPIALPKCIDNDAKCFQVIVFI
jgi:hypothetical protein